MICSKCEGTGKIRDNYTDSNGNYVLHKSTCDKCNGLGKVIMKKYAFSFRQVKKMCVYSYDSYCRNPHYPNLTCSEKNCPLLKGKEIK